MSHFPKYEALAEIFNHASERANMHENASAASPKRPPLRLSNLPTKIISSDPHDSENNPFIPSASAVNGTALIRFARE